MNLNILTDIDIAIFDGRGLKFGPSMEGGVVRKMESSIGASQKSYEVHQFFC